MEDYDSYKSLCIQYMQNNGITVPSSGVINIYSLRSMFGELKLGRFNEFINSHYNVDIKFSGCDTLFQSYILLKIHKK